MVVNNVFDALAKYASPFQVINRRSFNEKEKACVTKAEVVQSEYGSSVCFLMTDGCKTYIPVSRDSICSIGDEVNLDTSELLTLAREGSKNILRVEVK